MPELSSVGKMYYISVSKNNITTKSDTAQQVESFMEKDTTIQDKKKQKIDAILSSPDKILAAAIQTRYPTSRNRDGNRRTMSAKKEFGDFQTPDGLAHKVTMLVADIFGTPDLVVEPTAGFGAFLAASVDQWGRDCHYEGYEVNRQYVDLACNRLEGLGVELFHRDFFSEDWKHNLNRSGAKRVLVIPKSCN